MPRQPLIGVMGSARATDEECALAEEFGRLVANERWILLCGGRPMGIMDAAARGAHTAGGLVVGVLPGESDAPSEASVHLDIAIMTGMGDVPRNAINALSSKVMVSCRGGASTISEICLALTSGRSVILLGWDKPLSLLPQKYVDAGKLRVAWTPTEARDLVADILKTLNPADS